MKIQNSSAEDISDTLVAIELALEVLQQPLAVYDCSDAELDRSIQQFKMMRVAYLLLQRRAERPELFVPKAPLPVRSIENRDSLSVWTESQWEASGQ
jgi:hypothetical protein